MGVDVRYVKVTVDVSSGSPRIVEKRGPYTVSVDSEDLLDILEAVYEYDNLVQEDGPALTGYSVGFLDFVLVEWKNKRVGAYCAPRGWIVFSDSEDARRIIDEAELPLFISIDEIKRIYTCVENELISLLSRPTPLFMDDEFVRKYLRRGRKYQIMTILDLDEAR